MPSTHEYLVPALLVAKIEAMSPPKPLEQIARESGFRNVETLEHVINGDVALSPKHTFMLARSIGFPPAELLRLVIKDWRLESLVDPILHAFSQTEVTSSELELIALLREHRGSHELVVDDAVRDWVTTFPAAA